LLINVLFLCLWMIGIISVLSAVRNAFRITSSADIACALVLQANDELDKRHWIQCINHAISQNSNEQIAANVGYCSPTLSCHSSPVSYDYMPVVRLRIKPESPLSCQTDSKSLSPSCSPNFAYPFNANFGNSLTGMDDSKDCRKPNARYNTDQFWLYSSCWKKWHFRLSRKYKLLCCLCNLLRAVLLVLFIYFT